MHISEGVLSTPVIAGGWALGAAALALGLKKSDFDRIPKIALVSSVLFLASLVHVPVGPSSIHLTLLGLSGFILGWAALPALFAALFLQALLFQFGGLLSLGTNTAIMGSAALAGFAARRIFKKHILCGAFFAGFCACVCGAILITAALVLSSAELGGTAALIMAANIPLALVEGVLTFLIVLFLRRIKADVLE